MLIPKVNVLDIYELLLISGSQPLGKLSILKRSETDEYMVTSLKDNLREIVEGRV